MDILLPCGVFLFGVVAIVTAVCAEIASLFGLGAASEIWAFAQICVYLALLCVVTLFIYRAYQDDLDHQRRKKQTSRKRK